MHTLEITEEYARLYKNKKMYLMRKTDKKYKIGGLIKFIVGDDLGGDTGEEYIRMITGIVRVNHIFEEHVLQIEKIGIGL